MTDVLPARASRCSSACRQLEKALVRIIRLGPEIVERRARFSIKIQDNFKLISDYPSDLPDFSLLEVVRWPAFKCA